MKPLTHLWGAHRRFFEIYVWEIVFWKYDNLWTQPGWKKRLSTVVTEELRVGEDPSGRSGVPSCNGNIDIRQPSFTSASIWLCSLRQNQQFAIVPIVNIF